MYPTWIHGEIKLSESKTESETKVSTRLAITNKRAISCVLVSL